jgi:hypothetical protein
VIINNNEARRVIVTPVIVLAAGVRVPSGEGERAGDAAVRR